MILSSNIAFSQTKISREEAIEDLNTLAKNITKTHPKFHKKVESGAFRGTLINYQNTLSQYDSLSTYQFYKIIGTLPSSLNDGHTRLSHPKVRFSKVFPLRVNINTRDSVITISNDYSKENSIPIGSEIKSINGISYKEIVCTLMQYVSGELSFYKIHKLNQGSEFSFYFNMLFGSREYKIKYVYDNKEFNTSVAYIRGNKLGQKTLKTKEDKNLSAKFTPWEYYKEDNNKIGIIHIRSFMDYSYIDEFNSFLDSVFTDLQKNKVENLIIDIRKNGGGNTQLGDELLKYISPVQFKQFEKMIARQSFKRLKKTGNLSIFNPFSYGSIKTYDYDFVELKDSLHYTGQVYLLTSHSTFSAASSFSEAFKQFKMGVIIGEETGGMNVSYGESIHFTLPNSKLKYCISSKRYWRYNATEDTIHGTIPDNEIPYYEALTYTIQKIQEETIID